MSYTERQDGPEGQYVVLLTRLPYEQMQAIEAAAIDAKGNISNFTDSVLRNMAWEVHVKHCLTDEWTDDIGKTSPTFLVPVRDRAFELYLEWKSAAFPKAQAATEPETSESNSSSESPQSAPRKSKTKTSKTHSS